MSKFNTKIPTNRGAIKSSSVPATTFEGGQGFLRDEKSELFLATVSSLVEDTFYEGADERSLRIQALVSVLAVKDPEWIRDLVHWLRNTGNLRSIGLVVAAYVVKVRTDRGLKGHSRQIVRAALRRADEPGEFLGLWKRISGNKIPQPVKRGIADAVRDSLNEKSYIKWKGKGTRGEFSFRDILNITHVSPKNDAQSELFKHIINEEYGNDVKYDSSLLPVIAGRDRFLALSDEQRRLVLRSKGGAQDVLRAGLTWEALSGIMGGLDATVWEAVIPSMGYTALRMNLRNFEEAGVSPRVLAQVAERIASEDEVKNAGILPMQFLAAYKNAPSGFRSALEVGLEHSLKNVPELPGRTLILVDRSGSMFWGTSGRGSLTYADSAAIFGVALAKRAQNADLVAFGTNSVRVPFQDRGTLSIVDSMPDLGGTNTRDALARHYDGQRRVVVLTDEQYSNSYYHQNYSDVFDGIVPENVPTFTWNLAGYQAAQSAAKSNRNTFGGLTDFGFQLIPLLESGEVQDWSFLKG